MDDRYGNNRSGEGRWREQGQHGRYEERGDRGRDEDRGFFERAGDEVRSWFGDDDDDRRERGRGGYRDNQYGRDTAGAAGSGAMGGGWGNQTGDSWNRERPGVSGSGLDRHGSSGGWGSEHGSSDWDRERSSSSWGNESARRYAREDRGNSNWGAGGNSDRRDRDRSGSTHPTGHHGAHHQSRHEDRRYGEYTTSGGGGGGGPEIFGEPGQGGTSGFGGAPDNGRRFDRVDAGSTGTHGAHPMSSPVGGAYGGGYGIGASGQAGSSARYAGEMPGSGGSRGGGMMAGGAAAGGAMGAMGSSSSMGGGRQHDPHYSEWRNRQIESLDRDYDEYCREHQSRFQNDFGDWRTKRGEQRKSLGKVTEHMEVMGSDGEKIGVVDKVAGDRIILTRNDENAGGQHHSIPCGWIDRVEDRVFVNKSREEAMREWRNEDENRALFEREGHGSNGPHILNRSFSGTY